VLARGYRKIIDNVLKVLNSWKGKESEEKLKDILGQHKAQELMKNIKSKRK
jgi:hypothetical protein